MKNIEYKTAAKLQLAGGKDPGSGAGKKRIRKVGQMILQIRSDLDFAKINFFFFRSQEETRTEKSSSSSRDEDGQLGQENSSNSSQASSCDGTSPISQNVPSGPREETTQFGFGEESSGSRTWEGTHERGEGPVG